MEILAYIQKKFHFKLNYNFIEAGASAFLKYGTNMPDESFKIIENSDALLKSPVGDVNVRKADGTEAGLLGGVLRSGFDLYANIRPVYLKDKLDIVIIRENTEGLYASRGRGLCVNGAVCDSLLLTEKGCSRISDFAFKYAEKHNRKKVTLIDKSNVLVSFAFFKDIFNFAAKRYLNIASDTMYADACAYNMVINPNIFDVCVTENFVGDIISDLAAGAAGGLGFCGSANVGDNKAYFEPAHGSSPDIRGKNIANPAGLLNASAMMLEYLKELEPSYILNQALNNLNRKNLFDNLGRVKVKKTYLIENIKREIDKI